MGAVVAFYWQRLRRGVRKQTSVRCPSCHKAVPITAKICPNRRCKAPLTVDATVQAVFDPPKQRWRRFLAEATPATRRRIQWAYLLASGLALWWMLADLEKKQTAELFKDALMSVVYCAVIAFIVLLLVPRRIFQVVSQHTTALIKLALILNYLTLVLVLQTWISAWWARASILAGVFAVTWLAVWLLTTFLWPMKQDLQSLGAQAPAQRPLDHTARQGRRGIVE